MTIRFPRTVGAVSGWMMASFVLAVGLHSAVRFWRLPPWSWTAIFAMLVAAMLVANRGQSSESVDRTDRSERKGVVNLAPTLAIVLILSGFAVGWWRVETAAAPKLLKVGDKEFLVSQRQLDAQHPTLLGRWRMAVTARIESALPHDEATLVSGILYGDQDLSKTQKNVFVSSGLMHIVAVSGSNVTIVVQVVSFFMLGVGLRRRHAFIATTIALVLFVGFVGFSASVMRAAFMGWLMLLAREIGRPSSSSRLLLVAATILLAINPWQLLFDAGFALSFLAMWGLLAWSPLFGHWLAFLPDKLELRQTMSMTLAATLMTAPYLAWSFGRLTLIGILTNAVALPIVPFVMGSGAIAAIWGTWPGSAIVSAPALGLARMIQAIADSSSFLPWLNFEITGMKFSTCIATYVLLVYLRSLFSGKNDLSTEKRAS